MDKFNCLLFTTRLKDNAIVFENKKAREHFVKLPKSPHTLPDIFSKGSIVFYESYIKPMLIEQGECTEVQLSLIKNRDGTFIKVPCVANASFDGDLVYWSVYTAIERDKLYQELLDSRQKLEKKTEELTLLSRIDPLTGLLNRRATLQDLHIIEKQLQRAFAPIILALIDIDHFKQINDNYGHDKGDKIIHQLAVLLKKSARETDIVARWGGEEYLILLHNCSIEQSKIIFDKLHNTVKHIATQDGKPISVSIGVAELENFTQSLNIEFEQLIKKADQALYFAKSNGRAQTRYFNNATMQPSEK